MRSFLILWAWTLSAGVASAQTAAPSSPIQAGLPSEQAAPAPLQPAPVQPAPVQPATAPSGSAAINPDLPLREFRPIPKLRVPAHELTRAAFPVVDVHTHFFIRVRNNEQTLRDYVDLMNRNNIAVCCSLDAKLGAVEDHLKFLWTDYRDRFIVFTHLDFQGSAADGDYAAWACNQSDFIPRVVHELREAKKLGISGVKFFKQFGLEYRDSAGKLFAIDDPRFDPIWQVCGELGLPILIHTADPSAFFDPITPENERFEELSRRPQWSFFGPQFPKKEELIAARNRVIQRHPQTIFIAAHIANTSEDLGTVDQWLETYPNMYIELASRIAELGRQPYTARDFLIKNASRVLFGTDGPWPEKRVRYYWRFLETRDEYFPYAENDFPPQGFWRIYGVYLPEETLKKIYYENASKIIPGVAQRLPK
jgi:predicted TIM-barrel fold metal-dependent hydrolase